MCVLYRFRKVGRGCFFATLYISSLSPILSRFNCMMDNLPYSPSRTPVRLFIYLLFDSVVHPLRLVGLLSSSSFDGGNRSDNGLVRVWPAENSPIVQLCLPLTRRQAPPLLASTLNKQLVQLVN